MTDENGTVVRIDIPPDHHPGTLRGDSPGSQLGREALTGVYDTIGKINDTAAQVTDKARLAAAAQPIVERALERSERAVATLTAQRDQLDQEIAEAITPLVEPALAAQVRTHWAASAGAKKLTALREVIEAGDTTTMSAVLGAPAYLSGLSEHNQGLLRVNAAQTVAPERVQARRETEAALTRVQAAAEHLSTTMAGRLRSWRDEDSRIIAEGLR